MSSTAVFCANDHMAIGVLRALAEMGRQVPEEVSVVGLDDIPEAAYTTPPLTTVRLDFDALGQHCMAVLHALVTGAESGVSRRTRFAVEVVSRGSAEAVGPVPRVAGPTAGFPRPTRPGKRSASAG